MTFLFKPNATMNYHDSRWRNNERNHLDSYFSVLKPLLEAFKFMYILWIIQLKEVQIYTWFQYMHTS